MLVRRLLAAALVVLSLALAVKISEVRIVGADPVLATLAEIALPVRPGDEVDPENLEELARAVLETGYFKEARARLEGDVLVVEVVPNPKIKSVEVKAQAFDPEKLKEYLADRLALIPGTTFNPKKAEEGRRLLAELYRNQGFPFTPEVTLAVEEGPDGVSLVYEVKESVPIKGLKIKGANWVPLEEIKNAFLPLVKKGEFDWELYLEAVRRVGELYAERGYRGSGVDLKKTRLEDGVLTVYIKELKVVAVDPDGLPRAPVAVGEPFNYDELLERIAELTRELRREVRFEAIPEGEGVRLVFSLGEKKYGTITEVRIEGATAFSEEELKKLLLLREGDPFSPELAKADFERLLAHYRRAGYALVPRPDFSFENGVYTQRLHEVKIAGYRLVWQGRHRTQDFVILRELPPPGSLFSVPEIRKAIGRILRLGILAGPPEVKTEPAEREDEVYVVLKLKEGKTVTIAPAIAWSSQSGWSGQVTLADKNLWGRAHQASLNLAFVENDAGENISFSLSYRVPWLYIDFADFKEVPTAVSFSLYSIPYGNFKLTDAEGNETGWEYTERRSGARLSLARPLSDTLSLELGLEGQWVVPKLETQNPPEDPAITEEEALALLPKSYVNTLIGTTLTYSDVPDPNYPTRGMVLKGHGGFGLVFPEGEPTAWFAPTWGIYKTYQALDETEQTVIALRLAGGVIWGEPPESRYFSLGGSEPELTMLRGYSPASFRGTRLVGGSVELRHDFRFESTLTRTIIGIVFADVGATWAAGEEPVPRAGFGIGVQLNLGYGAVQLPAIRLDYGFSAENPRGILHFRIGPVF